MIGRSTKPPSGQPRSVGASARPRLDVRGTQYPKGQTKAIALRVQFPPANASFYSTSGSFTLFLESVLPAHPPCHPALLHSVHPPQSCSRPAAEKNIDNGQNIQYARPMTPLKRWMNQARKTTKLAFAGQDVKLPDEFLVGFDRQYDLGSILARASFTTDDVTQKAAKDGAKGSTSKKNADATDLYERLLTIQNTSDLQWPASNPANAHIPDQFRLNTFPLANSISSPTQPATRNRKSIPRTLSSGATMSIGATTLGGGLKPPPSLAPKLSQSHPTPVAPVTPQQSPLPPRATPTPTATTGRTITRLEHAGLFRAVCRKDRQVNKKRNGV